ncbi:MAG: coniferyl aldehyde dehydrogenase [Parashewanella sp.]
MSKPMELHLQQIAQLKLTFEQQKNAFAKKPHTEYEQRVDTLKTLKKSILLHQKQLLDALDMDYSGRAMQDSLIGDILPAITHLDYTLSHLKSWMKPSRRSAGMLLAPASVKVHYQPKGVVGIIVPWNFPIMLSFGPLITALAAGNHALLKLSEFTPNTNKVIKAVIESACPIEQVAVIEGEAEVASAFSSLPFDHLLFTGSTAVGRHVMKAAAENLTPVTLELGGKSPTIIADDIDIETAVERLIYGKCLNSGQICVAPDYILCPQNKIEHFIKAYQIRFNEMYPTVNGNLDYGSIINQRQFERLQSLLTDAKDKGATIVSAANEEIDTEQRKFATQLLTNVTDEMLVMQDEIFGPILPIVGYRTIDDAIEYVNQRPRPLALYIMSFDTKVQQQILNHTHSGGVCINETVVHVAADDAPFGGTGPSGMGNYHGKEGFMTFSHAKTVFSRGRLNIGKMVQPPYGTGIQKLLFKWFIG